MTRVRFKGHFMDTYKLCVCVLDKCTSVPFHETEQIKLVSNTVYIKYTIIIRM